MAAAVHIARYAAHTTNQHRWRRLVDTLAPTKRNPPGIAPGGFETKRPEDASARAAHLPALAFRIDAVAPAVHAPEGESIDLALHARACRTLAPALKTAAKILGLHV